MINPKSSVPRIVAANVCSGVPRPTACGRNAIQACELDSCGGAAGQIVSPSDPPVVVRLSANPALLANSGSFVLPTHINRTTALATGGNC